MTNKELAVAFREIGHCLKLTGEENEFRIKAYFRAAQQIELLDKELKDLLASGEAYFTAYLAGHKHVGDKSRAKIHLLILTGTCPELDAVRRDMAATGQVYNPEQKDVNASDKSPKKTTRKASQNLREEVTAIRRPWAQADAVVQRVLPFVQLRFGMAQVCGSYRRQAETVKDIDIAVASPKGTGLAVKQAFQEILNDLAIDPKNVVKMGEAQMSFYIASPSGEWQVDIWFVEQASFGSAILFATGSADFNVEMRGWLKAQGYKLNRYGLFKRGATEEEDILWASATEEGIFNNIGLEWVPPPERIHFDPHRKLKSTTQPANESV